MNAIPLNLKISTRHRVSRDLGAIIKNHLWNLHVSRLGKMERAKFILDRKTLQTIYFFIIRPLEYADIIRDNSSNIYV